MSLWTFWKPWLMASLAAVASVQPLSTAAQATQGASVRHYLYVLHLPPRLQDSQAWKPEDNAAVGRHFERLKQATAQGKVILAGRTDEPLDRTFGLVVFEAESEAAAREFMAQDPAVAAGVMTATLHPYSLALLRK